MIAIHARGWGGGGYSLEFEVRYHVLLLLYCVVNFIRETSLWYIGWSYTIRIKLYGVHFLSNIFWISFSSDNFWPMYGNPGCKYFITVSVANSKFQCLFAIFLLNLLQHKGSLEKGVVLYTEIFSMAHWVIHFPC